MTDLEFKLSTESELVELGRRLSVLAESKLLVTLSGDLGAGKTTLIRGLVQGAGFDGLVKSPTFSLVEPYEIGISDQKISKIYHFDLYRLQDPEELDYIGMRDYLDEDALCLIEWPEKAGSFLPKADINIMIEKHEKGRRVRLVTASDRGQALIERLALGVASHETSRKSERN